MSRRSLVISLCALIPLAAAALLLWLNYDQLPERMPTHWNGAGEPDAFEPKTPGRIFTIVVMGGAIQLVLVAVFYAASHSPNPKDRLPRWCLPVVMWVSALMISCLAVSPIYWDSRVPGVLAPGFMAVIFSIVGVSMYLRRRR